MAESKSVTVYHPAFADISKTVSASEVDEWVAAGWRKTPLKSE